MARIVMPRLTFIQFWTLLALVVGLLAWLEPLVGPHPVDGPAARSSQLAQFDQDCGFHAPAVSATKQDAGGEFENVYQVVCRDGTTLPVVR